MLRVQTVLTGVALTMTPMAEAADDIQQSKTAWQTPPKEVMEVLHAPQLPWVWTAPTGEHLLLADPVTYPPLAELAAPMHKLAGMRVDPVVSNIHGRHGATSPRLVEVESGAETPLDLPKGVEVHAVSWRTASMNCPVFATRESSGLSASPAMVPTSPQNFWPPSPTLTR